MECLARTGRDVVPWPPPERSSHEEAVYQDEIYRLTQSIFHSISEKKFGFSTPPPSNGNPCIPFSKQVMDIQYTYILGG